jgi:hypothetical protein
MRDKFLTANERELITPRLREVNVSCAENVFS